MGKQSRNTGRLKLKVQAPPTKAPSRSDRIRLAAVGGVVGVLVIGTAVAAIALGAAFGGGNSGLPPGTQVFAENDHSHVTGSVTYDRVPPAGGPHNAVQLNCGIYVEAVPNENAVHSLEHGAVWITYQPSLPSAQVTQLQQIAQANYVGAERYIIVSPYPGLPSPIVISAWGAQLSVNDASDSRLVDFIHHFAGGGQGGEPGGACTGGLGNPLG